MSRSGPNPADDESLLDAIESDGLLAESSQIRAMRQDRAALRGALKADFARPLPPRVASRLSQALADEFDREALAQLANGRPIPIARADLGRSMPTTRAWRRAVPIAACLALLAGVTWIAFRPSPGGRTGGIASPSGPSTTPSWAILPDPKPAEVQVTPPRVQEAPVQLAASPESTQTRDAATAVIWAQRGVLAVRLVTDSPTRDQERLSALTATRRSSWRLMPGAPASIAAVAANPWPIDRTFASESPGPTKPTPSTATLQEATLSVAPTAAAFQSFRDDIEKETSATVVFERVEKLSSFAREADPGAPATASDVVWWTKPASEWTPRIKLPLLLEYGKRPTGR